MYKRQVLRGQFPRYIGEIETLGDGRHRVRLALSARDIEIVGHPSYTGMTRGDGFFQADRYPEVTFVSDPYPPVSYTHLDVYKRQVQDRQQGLIHRPDAGGS